VLDFDQVSGGALLLFTLFTLFWIKDSKTTLDRRSAIMLSARRGRQRFIAAVDPDPCQPRTFSPVASIAAQVYYLAPPIPRASAAALGVKIEAEYTVGEYNILILSAVQSDGLANWLTPKGRAISTSAMPRVRSIERNICSTGRPFSEGSVCG